MYDSVFSQMTNADTNDVVEFNVMDMDNMAIELGLTPAEFMADPASLSDFTDPMMALVPRMGTQDRRTQLLLMGWPLHLPEPEVTRHLYVINSLCSSPFRLTNDYHGCAAVDEKQNGKRACVLRVQHARRPAVPWPDFLRVARAPAVGPEVPVPGPAACDVRHREPVHGRHPAATDAAPFAGLSLYAHIQTYWLIGPDLVDISRVRLRRTQTANGQVFSVDELFPGRWRQFEQRPDSFAEQQAKFAKIAGDAALDRGERLEECLQSELSLISLRDESTAGADSAM